MYVPSLALSPYTLSSVDYFIDALVICPVLECDLAPLPLVPLVRLIIPLDDVLIEACSMVCVYVMTHICKSNIFTPRRLASLGCESGTEVTLRTSASSLI